MSKNAERTYIMVKVGDQRTYPYLVGDPIVLIVSRLLSL